MGSRYSHSSLSQVVDFPATLLESLVRLLTAVMALGRQNGRLASFLAVMPLDREGADLEVEKHGKALNIIENPRKSLKNN